MISNNSMMENPNETTQRYNANEARIDPFWNLSEGTLVKVQCSERNKNVIVDSDEKKAW